MSQVVAEQSFHELSKKVVEQFLQTVVVLDDGAYMGPPPSVGDVQEPDENAPLLEGQPEKGSSVSEVSERPPNPLNAQALIAGFAEHGLVCAVFAPTNDANGSVATLRTSKRADIVILDWRLGDQGEQTLDIIDDLIKQDENAGGRLRMIVIYTASPNLEEIRETVSKKLSNFDDDDRPDNVMALKAPHTSILFIRKGSTSGLVGQIDEADLPRRVVEEFVQFGKGILANVAFGCIAAIREETHRVLARFHPGVDAPFLTHRVLLETPEDAEGYSVDLLSSEFAALLQQRGIGSEYAGRDAIRLALAEHAAQNAEFRLMKDDSAGNPDKITLDDLMKLVDCGLSALKTLNVSAGIKKAHKRLYLLLSENLETGKASHSEFARTSAHAREHVTVESDYRAKLDLGSIVLLGDEYFACIQPSCDALRLSDATQFIFAPLLKDESSFDVVVRDLGGNDICLKLKPKASEIRTVSFNPENGIVLTSAKDDVRKFTSISDEDFIWICDLRTSFAQRFVHRIASDLSRIGLDEFEWQRRHSSGD